MPEEQLDGVIGELDFRNPHACADQLENLIAEGKLRPFKPRARKVPGKWYQRVWHRQP